MRRKYAYTGHQRIFKETPHIIRACRTHAAHVPYFPQAGMSTKFLAGICDYKFSNQKQVLKVVKPTLNQP